MLSEQDNELITKVGPGTPAGELLRRYWHPVAYAQELTAEVPTRFVRVLGEDLVLFRDKSGRVGLLADHCSHRGASLLYGRVEERGIACAYHGWLYDCDGNILETPPERNDAIMRSVKHTAYPVQKFIGMYWAYMGPPPAPVIPKYDLWTRKDGTINHLKQPRLDCNWVQTMENSADPVHAMILHQNIIGRDRGPAAGTTRGFIDSIESIDFHEVSYGLMKTRTPKKGSPEIHPLIFPNMLRQGNAMQIRVPIDDTHTEDFLVVFTPSEDGKPAQDDGDPAVTYMPPHKNPPEGIHPFTKFDMEWDIASQDHMAWETQGAIADRSAEHLASSDRGVVMYRTMLKREIDKVQQGRDPIGVYRDPDHEVIDTNLDNDIRERGVYSYNAADVPLSAARPR